MESEGRDGMGLVTLMLNPTHDVSNTLHSA